MLIIVKMQNLFAGSPSPGLGGAENMMGTCWRYMLLPTPGVEPCNAATWVGGRPIGMIGSISEGMDCERISSGLRAGPGIGHETSDHLNIENSMRLTRGQSQEKEQTASSRGRSTDERRLQCVG